MQLNYDRIIKNFQNNIGPLSIEGTALDIFFNQLPVSDRSQAEYFIRTELGGNPINEEENIVAGQYWGSDGIQKFVIPPTIKTCAEGAFKDSDLEEVVIASPLDGTLNLDIFAGANQLKVIAVDPAIANNIKKLKAKVLITRNSNFAIKLPSAILDGLMDGSLQMDVSQAAQEFMNEHIEEI